MGVSLDWSVTMRRAGWGGMAACLSLGFDRTQRRGERVYRQLGGVSRSRRQTANGRDYILPTQFANFLQRTAANQLSESRGACHGRDASFRLEARFGNPAAADFQSNS